MSEERFFYHKIGSGNKHAEAWLSGINPLQRPAAVISFGDVTVEDIKEGRMEGGSHSKQQARDFIETPEKNWNETYIVVVNTKAWFLKPAGFIEECRSSWEGGQNRLLKIMPVQIIKKKRLDEIPFILVSINSNRWLGSGTYRKITSKKNRGNLKAIYAVLGKEWEPTWYGESPLSLLECLSSVELETLVAKIFETQGFFVPAYRGGCLKGIDLLAYNQSPKLIHLHPSNRDVIEISPGEALSIQVKGGAKIKKDSIPRGTVLIGYGNSFEDEYVTSFDGDWLLKQVKGSPQVENWLRRSLEWVPETHLERLLNHASD